MVGTSAWRGPSRRAADTAAQVVKLRPAKGIGTINDQRVSVRDVQPRFNNGGAQQDIHFAFTELVHASLLHDSVLSLLCLL
jgi:hypothetical protein